MSDKKQENFRLSDNDRKLMLDLAKILGVSKSTAIRLLLREVVPALKRTTQYAADGAIAPSELAKFFNSPRR